MKTRYIPANYTKVISATGTDIYMATYANDSIFAAMGFSGKKSKPDFHYRFSTTDRRNDYVAKYEDKIRAYNKTVADRKVARYAPTTLKTGDILYSSWGYDQTNVDFYEVTKVIGKRMVEITPIASKDSGTLDGRDCGEVVAVPGKYIGAPMHKIAHNGTSISIKSFITAWPWDGKPTYYSTYA